MKKIKFVDGDLVKINTNNINTNTNIEYSDEIIRLINGANGIYFYRDSTTSSVSFFKKVPGKRVSHFTPYASGLTIQIEMLSPCKIKVGMRTFGNIFDIENFYMDEIINPTPKQKDAYALISRDSDDNDRRLLNMYAVLNDDDRFRKNGYRDFCAVNQYNNGIFCGISKRCSP